MTVIDLRGKVALVTGSAQRIGKTIALELARQGMNQVIHHNGSDARIAEATADEVRALGVEAIVVRADHSQPADVQRLFDAVKVKYGRLDVLVNNASILIKGSILDQTPEEWHNVLDANLTGPFLCSQHAARLMRESGDSVGAIINISDQGSFRPFKMFANHSVSKAGLNMLTQVLALSLAPDIRVNAIAPGAILRDEGNSPEQWAKIGQRIPVKHTGDPADVAQAVIFLATQPYITGTIMHLDGGEHLTAIV